MKSKIVNTDAEIEEREYPWMGIANDGDVVLFNKPSSGIVVFNGGSSEAIVGYYEDEWWMDSFTEFKGQVILSND